MKRLLTYLLLTLILSSCEELSDPQLQPVDSDVIVVDGIITNELKFQTITLSRPVTTLNAAPLPVTGAVIQVSSNQQVFTFHEDTEIAGKYISDKQFLGIRNRTYSLLISSGNNVYSSKAVLEAPAEFLFIQPQKEANGNMYRFTKIPSTYNPVKSAMYEILLDWSSAPGFENANADTCRARLYFYTLPTLDVSEVFAPGTEKVSFPAGTLVTERRYSLTDEHASFIRALLLETTWSGGYFNTANADIPTNLSEGAIGYFGACGVVEKSELVK